MDSDASVEGEFFNVKLADDEPLGDGEGREVDDAVASSERDGLGEGDRDGITENVTIDVPDSIAVTRPDGEEKELPEGEASALLDAKSVAPLDAEATAGELDMAAERLSLLEVETLGDDEEETDGSLDLSGDCDVNGVADVEVLKVSPIDSLGFIDEDGVVETVNTSVNVAPDETLPAIVAVISDEYDTAGLTEPLDESDGSDDSLTIVVVDGIEDIDTHADSLDVEVSDDSALDEPTRDSDGTAVTDT